MNRKLIRTTLAEIKERESHQKDQPANGASVRVGAAASTATAVDGAGSTSSARGSSAQGANSGQSGATTGRKRQPAAETNAEVFYYKKQIESHTPMVILLQDGEEIEGTIEWYDRSALKVNRKTAPNIMLLKHNIKYMYKAEDREPD